MTDTNPSTTSPGKLRGNRALITGASSGIGEQYARQLATQGCDLVLAARRVERLQALARELEGRHGVQIQVIQADLGAPGAAEKLAREACSASPPLTMLVNNAGIGPYAPFLETQIEKHTATIQLNVIALTELTHHVARHMVGHGRKSYISNVASIAAYQSSPFFAVYGGTKHFVRIFSEVIRHELRKTSISVSCLCPGGTTTEFLEIAGQQITSSGRMAMMSAEEVARQGIQGMLRGQAIIIPGLLNKIACLLPRFFSGSFAIAMAGLAMSRSVKRVQAKV